MPAVADPDPSQALPSEGVRTVVTFLLVIHFTALATIWLWVTALGRPAELVTRTYGKVFEPYALNLWLAVNYGRLETTGGRSVAGSVVIVDVVDWGSEGKPDSPRQLVFPSPTAPREARMQDQQRLLNVAAGFFQQRNDTGGKQIMDLIAGSVLHETKAKKIELQLRSPVDDRSESLDALRPQAQRPLDLKDYLSNRYESWGQRSQAVAIESGWIHTDATQKTESAPAANRGSADARPKNGPPDRDPLKP